MDYRFFFARAAEGCFCVIISKVSALRWRIIVSFEINLHSKDIKILNQIKDYFGVGSVTSRPAWNLCVYRVTKPEDLIKVIELKKIIKIYS